MRLLRTIMRWRPSYQYSKEFPVDRNDLFQACVKAVKQCGFHLMRSDKHAGLIMASVPPSFRSLGEVVEITIDASSVVRARSTLGGPRGEGRDLKLVSWGKNRDNIDALFYELEKILGLDPYQEKSTEPPESASTERPPE